MKHCKRPTLKQKKLIKANGLNPENWLVARETSVALYIKHRITSGERTLYKNQEGRERA